jgi:hypothetical protein
MGAVSKELPECISAGQLVPLADADSASGLGRLKDMRGYTQANAHQRSKRPLPLGLQRRWRNRLISSS